MIRLVMLPDRFEPEPVLRVQRYELGENSLAGPGLLRVQAVDLSSRTRACDLLPRSPSRGRRTAPSMTLALAQAALADLGERDVHTVRPRQVAGGADEGVSLRVEHVEDARDWG